MFNKLGEDQDSITVEGPTGQPVRIAKAQVDPSLLQSIMGAGSQPQDQGAQVPQPFSLNGLASTVGPNINAPQPPMASPAPSNLLPVNASPAEAPKAPQDAPQLTTSPETATATQPNPNGIELGGVPSLNRGIEMQQQAAQDMGKNAYLDGQRKAAEYKGLADQMSVFEKQRQDIEKQKETDLKTIQDQINKTSSEVSKNTPDKDFWADKGTGAKIGAAIAVAFGAFGSALTGGPNQALQIIQSAIENDNKKQLQRYKAIRGNLSDSRDAFGLMLKKYGDKESALLAMQESAYRKAQIKLGQYASQLDSADAQQKAKAMMGALEEKRGEILGKLSQQKAEELEKKRTSFVPHFGGYATSPEGAAKVNELAAATNSAKDNINQLLALSKMPAKSLDPETRAQANTTARMLQASLRVPILGPGTVQENERKLLEDIAGDPTRIFSLDNTNRKKLETLMDRLNANLIAQGRAYGLAPQVGSVAQGAARIGTPRQ